MSFSCHSAPVALVSVFCPFLSDTVTKRLESANSFPALLLVLVPTIWTENGGGRWVSKSKSGPFNQRNVEWNISG